MAEGVWMQPWNDGQQSIVKPIHSGPIQKQGNESLNNQHMESIEHVWKKQKNEI